MYDPSDKTIEAMKREIAAYTKLRNSIWFGVKINSIITLIVLASTLMHALIFWLDLNSR